VARRQTPDFPVLSSRRARALFSRKTRSTTVPVVGSRSWASLSACRRCRTGSATTSTGSSTNTRTWAEGWVKKWKALQSWAVLAVGSRWGRRVVGGSRRCRPRRARSESIIQTKLRNCRRGCSASELHYMIASQFYIYSTLLIITVMDSYLSE